MIEFKKFYVTTPIYYINDAPSIGTAYTTIVADVLARWHRLKGEDVFFLTGLDENSQKTTQACGKIEAKDIQAYANQMTEKFKKAWKKLDISFDGFIRTTEKRHEKFVLEFFERVNKKGDIYKGTYTGLYCDGCEAFLTENDLVDGKCPYHNVPPKQLSEENYFFKLSKYEKQLLDYIEAHPEFVQPKEKRNEVVNFIKQGLKDISISRDSLIWGIKLPIDEKQRFWVWFDALTNYLSAVDRKKFWPAELHLVGKDILRFHAIIWPAMLFSAGFELPKTVFAHGFFTVNGQKMSKSLGNAINPNYLVEKFSADAVRYYLIREIPFGQDGDFSEEKLIERINNELANDLGNLVYRILSLIEKKCNSKIPKGAVEKELEKELNVKKIDELFEALELNKGVSEIWAFVKHCNKFVNDKKVWELEGKALDNSLYSLADALRIIAILLEALLPETCAKINEQLGCKDGKLKDAKFGLIKSGTSIKKGAVLFKKI